MRSLIAAIFFLLAGWFIFGPGRPEIPIPLIEGGGAYDRTPFEPRKPLSEPPLVVIGGVEQRCNDCHLLFDSQPEAFAQLRQHVHLVHDHGMNDRCYNCHSVQDRSKLVLHGEKEIGYDQVVLLCAKCHGPTYRDWQRGMHGKTLGAWETGSSKQRRLQCTECHDPHSPAFKKRVPLPGPMTLRMGDQSAPPAGHDEGKVNPLRPRHRGEAAHRADVDQGGASEHLPADANKSQDQDSQSQSGEQH